MDQEKPTSLGSIATRIVCTLIGLLLLYVLGSGPVSYLWEVSPRSRPLIVKLYTPMRLAIKDTPLIPPVGAYTEWWARLAKPSPLDSTPQTTPTMP